MGIEKYLDDGYIRLGSIGERFFRASYVDTQKNIVTVDSQLGAMHLLYELEMKILRDIHKNIEALRVFQKENGGPLPTSFPLTDKMTTLDFLLASHAVVLVFKENAGCDGVCVCIFQTGYRETPEEKSNKFPPGVYVKHGFSSNFFEAIDRAIKDKEPVSIDLSPELPKRFFVNRS